VRLARDQGLPPAAQDASIARLRELAPVTVVELDTGHDVMISDPPALAAVLDEVAAAAS
jgi:pimeloyl-ACP methyl ester carboxylesterase